MNLEIIKYIIIGALVLGLLFYILRSLFQVIVIFLIISFLFGLGWTFNTEDLRDRLFLDRVVESEYLEDFYEKYDDYTEKRNKDRVLKPDKIEDTIKEELSKKIKDLKIQNKGNDANILPSY